MRRLKWAFKGPTYSSPQEKIISKEKSERPVLKASLEGAEVLADIALGGDVLAGVPIIGTAFNILKAADSIRDRAFAAKLRKFSTALEKISAEEKQEMQNKIRTDDNEANRVGETLFLVLDHLTDLSKATVLGYIFVSYLRGDITADQLRRMAQAIDVCFADDLNDLLDDRGTPYKSLLASGLAEPIGDGTIGGGGNIYYVISDLGRKLREAYISARKNNMDTHS